MITIIIIIIILIIIIIIIIITMITIIITILKIIRIIIKIKHAFEILRVKLFIVLITKIMIIQFECTIIPPSLPPPSNNVKSPPGVSS